MSDTCLVEYEKPGDYYARVENHPLCAIPRQGESIQFDDFGFVVHAVVWFRRSDSFHALDRVRVVLR
ncbi:MAG: hypothetical protein DRH08_12910 [Deltaproteobacteria bacterium]|nr:MAG: hypothetical protein DRH08_12910 [Deltaproteobacteria bacterium]